MATIEELQERLAALKKEQEELSQPKQQAAPKEPEPPQEEEKGTLEALASAPAAVAGLVAGGLQGAAEGVYGAFSGSGIPSQHCYDVVSGR